MSWKSRSFSGKRPANSLLSVCQTWTKFDKLIHVDGKVSRYDIFADIIQEEQTVEESRWLFFFLPAWLRLCLPSYAECGARREHVAFSVLCLTFLVCSAKERIIRNFRFRRLCFLLFLARTHLILLNNKKKQ